MRMLTFAKRNAKEILRDPLTLLFSLGFPVVLLFLFTAIQANVPVSLFELEHIAPGLAVFGLSFMTLFSATLIAKDRETAFLQRLYTTPLTALDFILGYTLPMIPMVMGQSFVCYGVAVLLGLEISLNLLLAWLLMIPVSLFYIVLGLLCGSMLTVKQTGGICGALLTNLAAWLSGTWFDLELVGGAFQKVAYLLPFVHGVEAERAVFASAYAEILPNLAWVLGYTLVVLLLAVWAFVRQMNRQ